MREAMIEAQPRPTVQDIRVQGETTPGLTYRLFARTPEEAADKAIADYNRLFRVTDGKLVTGTWR